MRLVLIVIVFSLALTPAYGKELLGQEDDYANIKLGDIAPGYEYKISLPYHVQLQYGGDDEYKDSKVMVGNVLIEAGLGSDEVVFVVMKAGRTVYKDVLGSRQSLLGVEYKGTVAVVVRVTCNGLLQVFYKGNKIVEENVGTEAPVSIYKDDDARVDDAYKYRDCAGSDVGNVDIPASQTSILPIALPLALALLTVAVVVARQ